MNLTSAEQRKLAIECGAWSLSSAYSFNDKELATYTAAVEARRDESMQSEIDKRDARVAQFEEVWEYVIDDTWLTEHDKAVELKVLKKLDECTGEHDDSTIVLHQMIESRILK